MPVYVAARRRQAAARDPRGQRPARRSPTGSARACAPTGWRPPSRTRSCRTRATSVCRSAEPISTLDRADLRPLAREHFGLDQDSPTLLVTGGSQGARRINAVGRRPARRTSRAAGVQVLHVMGPKGERRSARRPVRRRAGVRRRADYVDRMDLAYAAADATVGRAGCQLGDRGCRARAAGRLRAACRSATASRRSTREPSSTPAGRVLVDDDDFTPDWVRAHVPGAGDRPGPARPRWGPRRPG